MLSAYLPGRVARRLFGRFLLAGAVPVALLGAFAVFQTGHYLLELTERSLREEAKAYGMTLIGKLNGLQQELRVIDQQAGPRLEIELSGSFDAVQLADPGDAGLTAFQWAHFDAGGAVLLEDPDGGYSLWLKRAQQPLALRASLGVATLWSEIAIGVPYCVLDSAGNMRFCTPDVDAPPSGLARVSDLHSGIFRGELAGEDTLVAFWRGSLAAIVAHPGFTLTTFYPRAVALAPLRQITAVIPVILALALVIAAWLAMGQIRRSLDPLDTLATGARRLAAGDFDARVPAGARDEFGEVAQAFNAMALRLSQRFRLVEALAELDRAILTGAEMGHVVRTVLEHAPGVVSCDYVGVLHAGGGLRAGPALLVEGDGVATLVRRTDVDVSAKELALLAGAGKAVVVDLRDSELPSLVGLARRGLAQAWAFPAGTEGRLSATLVLGFVSPPDDGPEIESVGRCLADRLAIAGSNLEWGEKLYRNAHYDALTGLPNRVLLRDRIEQAMSRARQTGSGLAVMVLDLDRFREVNDSLGHSAGDRLLCAVAGRLADCMPETDTLARLGGDEFVILQTQLERNDEGVAAATRVEQLQEAMRAPFDLAGRMVSVDASIGIALFPGHAETVEGLLKGADAAMYEAKQDSSTHYRFFSDDIDLRAHARFRGVQQLWHALENGEFELYYQPKVHLGSNKIVGAEALLRWHSPDRGLVSPAEFVPLLEEIGLSAKVGGWVIRQASAQAMAWERQGLPPIAVSVNVSPAQFLTTNIVAEVQAALGASGLPPERFELEILEESAIDPSGQTREVLLQLRELGVWVALDDFGTGYSSLIHLTQIPANVLKLDRAFIASLASDPRQADIVCSIIELAKRLDMQVVAEGVEEVEQRVLLEGMGCDLLQGYIFSRPVPANELGRLLATGASAQACEPV